MLCEYRPRLAVIHEHFPKCSSKNQSVQLPQMNYQTKMKVVCVLLLLCHVSSTVKHSLKYFQTASYGFPDFPVYVASATVDEFDAGYCDLKTDEVVLHEWIRDLEKDDPDHTWWYSFQCSQNKAISKANVDGYMRTLHQSGGFHISQLFSGCELDDETNETTGFLKYGYDGEDFIELDLQTMTWIAHKPEAIKYKLIDDADQDSLKFYNILYTYSCPKWLQNYLQYGSNFLLRPELPSVSLLQKSPSSAVSCFATGFYPNRAAVFWRKDGEELYEDVEHGEILPNPDHTFQMSVDLNISAVKSEDWGRYECVFQVQGVKEDIITKLDKAAIRSNYGSKPPSPSPSPVAGLVAGLLLLLVCIAGIFIWRKRIKRFLPVAGGERISEEESESIT